VQRLTDRRVIVTGAGSGIGRAIAHRMASEGARLLVADIDGPAVEEVAAEVRAISRIVDVSKENQVRDLVETAVTEWDGLDVMVNNAGVGIAATVPNTSEEDFERLVAVNLKGTFLGMKYAIPAIRNSGGGAVINMSSITGIVGVPERAVYGATKGGIYSLTRAAAIDHVAEGVRVNCIVPGTVDTPWLEKISANQQNREKAMQSMKARQPHGRFVSPEEIAAMAAYLASDEALSVIGAAMTVDGGVTAR
jgi:NAD(P)-dependent dehydrogenase (short-subunit alcohol dehydrogenase family)